MRENKKKGMTLKWENIVFLLRFIHSYYKLHIWDQIQIESLLENFLNHFSQAIPHILCYIENLCVCVCVCEKKSLQLTYKKNALASSSFSAVRAGKTAVTVCNGKIDVMEFIIFFLFLFLFFLSHILWVRWTTEKWLLPADSIVGKYKNELRLKKIEMKKKLFIFIHEIFLFFRFVWENLHILYFCFSFRRLKS